MMRDETAQEIGGVVLMLILWVPMMLLGGWVFSCLWGWFVVPLGAQHLGVAHAIGLSAVATFPLIGLFQATHKGTSAMEGVANQIARGVIFMLVLFVGWCVHGFMP